MVINFNYTQKKRVTIFLTYLTPTASRCAQNGENDVTCQCHEEFA